MFGEVLINVNEAALQQNAFLSSILAGFSITIVIQLISMKDNRGITIATITAFIVATLLMLIETYLDTRTLIRLSYVSKPYSQEVQNTLSKLADYQGTIFVYANLAFLTGVALSGWIHSKVVGLISTLSVIVFIIFFWKLTDLVLLIE